MQVPGGIIRGFLWLPPRGPLDGVLIWADDGINLPEIMNARMDQRESISQGINNGGFLKLTASLPPCSSLVGGIRK